MWTDASRNAMIAALKSQIQTLRNASTQAHQDGEPERGRKLWAMANEYSEALSKLE